MPKFIKFTYEDFIKKATAAHNGRYIYNEDTKRNYNGALAKVPIVCPDHGVFWQSPKAHANGQGCPICGKKVAYTHTKGKYQHFLDRAKEKFSDRYEFPDIENEYENNHSKITIKCTWCGNTFIKRAGDFLNSLTGGCWCKENKEEADEDSITYRELKPYALSNPILPFEGTLSKKKDKVVAVCPEHGEYNAPISRILEGKCPCWKCAIREFKKKNVMSADTVQKRIDDKFGENGAILDKSTYVNTAVKATFTCKHCGRKFTIKPNNLFQNNSKYACSECSKKERVNKNLKPNAKFIDEVKSIYGDSLTIISEYKKSSEKVKVHCNECGRDFYKEANSLLQGNGCPYHHRKKSYLEEEVYDFVKSLSSDAVASDRIILKGYELDVYVPSKKIAIEFDGLFWHSEVKKEPNYHLWKTEMCEKQGIRLIHIFEDEWLYKKEIWKSMLCSIFGTTENRIYARKCDIKEVIDVHESTEFLKANHLQGWCPSSLKLGLYYNDEIVSIMTFGKSRHFIGSGKYQWELLRFCNKLNTSVIGGASKLFKYFIDKYQPKNIVSYADRRWSEGNLYYKLGFALKNYSKPNYYYVIGDKRKYRFEFRKSVLVEKYGCPIDMSEKEFCFSQHWYRIYDCGAMAFIWESGK